MFQDNPFSDVELLPAPVVASQNPYAAPCEQWRGQYDWTLFKRVLLWFAFMSIFYLLCDVFVIWQAFDAGQIDANHTVLDGAKAFLFDWRLL